MRSLLEEHPGVQICNLNAPEQQVAGGGTEAVDRLIAACSESDVSAQRIPVAAAFHTEHVAHAVEQFGEAVAAVTLRPPNGRVYANTPGAAYGDDIDANRRVLTEQLTRSVDFVGQVERLYDDGFRIFVEFGPKSVLSQLVSSTVGDREAFVVALDGGPGRDADVTLKQGVVQLVVLGVPLVGVNRYLREPLPAPESKGIQVMLNGIDHVSDSRREDYQDALENGYQVPGSPDGDGASPGGEPPAREAEPVAPAAQDNGQQAPAPASPQAPVPAASAEHVLEVAEQNLGLHSEYLAGQLDTASRLVSLLEQHSSDDGGPDEGITRGVEAVKDHGLAVGHAHERANEVLRDLVAMELGAAPVQAPSGATTTAHRADEPAVPEPTDGSLIDASAAESAPELTAPPAAPTEPAASTEPARPAEPAAAPAGPEPQPAADDAGITTAAAGTTTAADGTTTAEPEAAEPGQAPATDGQAAGLDAEAARSALAELVAEKTGYPADMLEPDMDVEADLGIDSIKRLQIMGALRDKFPQLPEIGPESMAELRTLDDIAGLLAGDLPASGAEAATGDGSPDGESSDRSYYKEAVGPSHEQLADAEGKVADRPGQPDAQAEIARGQATVVTLPPVERLVDAFAPGPVALIVDDGDDTCPALQEDLTGAGWRTHVLPLPGNAGTAEPLQSWDEDELANRLEALLGKEPRVDLVVVSAARPAEGWDEAQQRCLHALLVAKHTQRPLLQAAGSSRAAFLTVTRLDGALGHRGAAAPTAVLGGIAGLVKTMAIEAPDLFCRAVDLAKDIDAATAARLVLDEANDASVDVIEVGYDGEHRQAVTVTDASTPDDLPELAPPGQEDLLVVTGGARGVTAHCAVGLADRYGCRLLLLGRTKLADEPEWAAGKDGDADLKRAITERLRSTGESVKPKDVQRVYREITGSREVRNTLEAIRSTGAHAEYCSVDIADEAATTEALAPHTGKVTGVVHGAGAVADRLIADKRPDDVQAVFAPKLRGLRNVLAALPAERIRHLVLFSSVAGFFGNSGQADYAMANEALNRLARGWKRERGDDSMVTAINWGAWAGGMVTPELAKMFTERGVELVPVDVGVRMLVEQFTPERAHDVVTVIAPVTPPSARHGPAGPSGGAQTERTPADLVEEPVLADHRIGGQVVLPATVALGWCINAAERLLGGRTAVECRDFRVHNGVVFDGSERAPLRLHAKPSSEAAVVALTIRSEDGERQRPHYAAKVVLDGEAPRSVPRIDGLPSIGHPADDCRSDGHDCPGDGHDCRSDGHAGVYEDGTLFHGPALRGIRRVLAEDGERMVFECRLADHRLADGAYAGKLYSPVLTDLMLQAPLVAVRKEQGLASLPVGIGRVELYERLPDDEPFLVVVEDIRKASGSTVTSTVTACTPDGRVLARFVDVAVVASADLAEKFTTS